MTMTVPSERPNKTREPHCNAPHSAHRDAEDSGDEHEEQDRAEAAKTAREDDRGTNMKHTTKMSTKKHNHQESAQRAIVHET